MEANARSCRVACRFSCTLMPRSAREPKCSAGFRPCERDAVSPLQGVGTELIDGCVIGGDARGTAGLGGNGMTAPLRARALVPNGGCSRQAHCDIVIMQEFAPWHGFVHDHHASAAY